MRRLLVWLALWGFPALLFAQYPNVAEQDRRIESLDAASEWAQAEPLGETRSGQKIWLIRLSANAKPDEQRGFCVLGGLEGGKIYTVELALRLAETLAAARKGDSLHRLLQNTTFYIFPNLSPEAGEQLFRSPRYLRYVNDQPTDDDKDGQTNEDPFNDLNADGWITAMRVADPAGEWTPDPDEPLILRRADPKKGEKGQYRLLTEGIDDDKDGLFNEDPQGGVHPNKNFSYAIPNFQPDAGKFPTEAPEIHTVVDYLFKAKNVYALYVLSARQNLISPPQALDLKREPKATAKPNEKDAETLRLLADWYKATCPTDGSTDFPKPEGDALSWGYYHYGRLAMGSPAWLQPKPKYTNDPNLSEAENKARKRLAENENPAIRALYALRQTNPALQGAALNWTQIAHPQFPNQTVEVGGVLPGVIENPPFAALDSLSRQQTAFLVRVARAFPQLKLANPRAESLGGGVYRLSVTLYNAGLLPTHTEEGADNKFIQRITCQLSAEGATLLSGRPLFTLDPLPADGSHKLTWTVRGKGVVKLKAGCPTAGWDETAFTLNP